MMATNSRNVHFRRGKTPEIRRSRHGRYFAGARLPERTARPTSSAQAMARDDSRVASERARPLPMRSEHIQQPRVRVVPSRHRTTDPARQDRDQGKKLPTPRRGHGQRKKAIPGWLRCSLGARFCPHPFASLSLFKRADFTPIRRDEATHSAGCSADLLAGFGAPTRNRRSDSESAPPNTITTAPSQISSTSGLW